MVTTGERGGGSGGGGDSGQPFQVFHPKLRLMQHKISSYLIMFFSKLQSQQNEIRFLPLVVYLSESEHFRYTSDIFKRN
jgi:hypothetical protein